MITPDGWLDWAIRLEPTNRHVNPGTNPVNGAFFHSAEGYASVLLDPNSIYGYNGRYSWHFTNVFNGTVYQHYPFTARCWHATAANDDYIGGENEGYQPNEKSLTDPQVTSLRRITADLIAWPGAKMKAATRTGDKSQTLWEHREVVWLGGTSTTCPNGRIPWDKILEGPGGSPVNEADELELADRRAAALVVDAINFPQGGDSLYRPVAVAEQNGMLLIEFWTKERKRPPEPVPALWVKKP